MQQSAICLIVKNEVHDIAEWVVHHSQIVGADQLIIYDDNSNDGTTELLEKLSGEFPIRVIPWKTNEAKRQVAAYTDCLKRFGSDFEWIGFLDSDEFLIPPPGTLLPQLLERHQNHDAFSINWLIFGTSGVADTNGRLIMETFTNRANVQFSANQNVKTFIRPSAFKKVLNPHYIEGPQHWTDVLGNPIEWDSTGVVKPGKVVMGDWTVNHYVLRSDRHIAQRLARGRTDTNEPRNIEFFCHHDQNDVPDQRALPYATQVRQILVSNKFLAEGPPPNAIMRLAEGKEQSIIPGNTPVARNIHLHLDRLRPESVGGWAVDHAATNHQGPLELVFFIDGTLKYRVTYNMVRLDLKRANLKVESGFDFILPRSVFDGHDHVLTVQTPDHQDIIIHRETGPVLRQSFNEIWRPKILSHVDGFHEGVLKGWVLREQEGKMVGGLTLAIYSDDTLVGYTYANRTREDVGITHSAADTHCGFQYNIPSEFHTNRPQKFNVRIVPDNIELHGSPVQHNFFDRHQKALLTNLRATADEMYRTVSDLRHQLRMLTPSENFTLSDYTNVWAQRYREGLSRRSQIRRRSEGLTAPEPPRRIDVSFVCRIHKPNIGDFIQTIESVIKQTYVHWELLLVDDNSQMPDLIAQIAAFAQRDERIKAIPYSEDAGKSTATDAAFQTARGKWVMFLNPESLLADVALEVMLKQARTLNATVVYADHDHLDSNGDYINPALKPDFNYRYLLSKNYIGSSVLFSRSTLQNMEGFPVIQDDAFLHDILLRLSEVLPPDAIRHIPNILFHLRTQETSITKRLTASPSANDNGSFVVQQHLQRLGLPAQIERVPNTSGFRINWSFTNEPKVCIIIPFKDQIEITRKCLDLVLTQTQYANFEVVLVDNWSVAPEAHEFCNQAIKDPRVRVMREEIPFNYSTLNNRAARTTNADYLVLMNNDLHIRHGSWLRKLMNEILANKDVGVVGGKFFYPNGSTQHAGVVTGIGGVACHINNGLGEQDPGYEERALLTQELSVVTAACLLIEKDLFWKVGGLNEKNLRVAFNDVHLCLEARRLGRKVVWVADFLATHYESISRGVDSHPQKEGRFFDETQFMIRHWGPSLKADPNYHPLFDLNCHTPFYGLVAPTKVLSRPVSLNPFISG